MAIRGATETYKCKRCKQPFTARVADRNRGWARFCSKSCKAIRQEQRTGQYADRLHRKANTWIDDAGNRCTRFAQPWGKSIVQRVDHQTGEVEIEHFNKHGLSEGFRLGPDFGMEDA